MPKKILFLLFGIIFLMGITSANLNLFPRDITSPNQNIKYIFNFTTDVTCLNVLLSHSEIVSLDISGVGFVNISLDSLNGTIPSYLCVQKDNLPLTGSPFNFSDIIFNSIRVNQIYAGNITTSNLNVTGNYIYNGSDRFSFADLNFTSFDGNGSYHNIFLTNQTNNINTTQFSISNGILNILESWLTTFITNIWNTLFPSNVFYTNNFSSAFDSNFTPYGLVNNNSYLSTFNQTYDSYATNVSKNWTQETFNAYNASWASSSSGNPFDQSLNTTDNVTFNSINITGNNPYVLKTGDTMTGTLRVDRGGGSTALIMTTTSASNNAPFIMWDDTFTFNNSQIFRGAIRQEGNKLSFGNFPNGSSFATYLTLLNGGNVGIGTITPSNTLDVRGIINASGMIYYNNGTPVTIGIGFYFQNFTSSFNLNFTPVANVSLNQRINLTIAQYQNLSQNQILNLTIAWYQNLSLNQRINLTINQYLLNANASYLDMSNLSYQSQNTSVNAWELIKNFFVNVAWKNQSNIFTQGAVFNQGVNISRSLNVTGNLTVGGQVSITGASRMRVTRDSIQSIPSGAFYNVQYDNETFDNLGEYDNVTNHVFTANQSGYYQASWGTLSASVVWTANDVWHTALYKNGNLVSYGYRNMVQATFTGYLSSIGSDLIYLNAGDYIDIRVYIIRSLGVNLYPSGTYNFFAVHRLS